MNPDVELSRSTSGQGFWSARKIIFIHGISNAVDTNGTIAILLELRTSQASETRFRRSYRVSRPSRII